METVMDSYPCRNPNKLWLVVTWPYAEIEG